jgi:hypothetical protein
VSQSLTRTAATAAIAVILLALAPSAFAASESGDAGGLPSTAQDVGSGAVTQILGSFTGGADVDVYRVCLTDGASFSASTVAPMSLDTQLFLFDADGLGVYANDDAGIGVRGSRLPARHRFSPTSGGEYYVALSSFNNDPRSAAGEIFPDVFSASLYPDGVVNAAGGGSDEPVSSWVGLTRGPAGLYSINLTGTTGCDTTPPTVALSSPADGARVKQGAELDVDFSCSDTGGSGLASCVGSVADGAALDTSELGEVSVTVTALDHAGNRTVVTHTVTVVDQTKPTISVTTPVAGAQYELGEQVLADYSCADEPTGSGLDSCVGSVANGAAVDTESVGEKTFTVEASDNAGNTASKTVSYTVADRTAPTITLTRPAEGAMYTLGEQVLADYSCADEPNGSGVASCQGSVPAGAALDTSEVGAKTFEVSTTDNAGNHASTSVAYSVVYDFDGFLWPLQNLPQVNRWKAGRPVPVRFSLGSYRGHAPVAAGYPAVAPVACGEGAQPVGIERARGTWLHNWQNRSRRGRATYTFLWKTETKWAGDCRQLVLKLDDGTMHSVEVQFVRRGNTSEPERRGHDEP